MWVRPPLSSDLPGLVQSMRPADAREIYALRADQDPFRLVGELFGGLPFALTSFVAGVDHDPSAIAFLAVWPKGSCRELGDAAMFATRRFALIARPLIAHVRESVIPGLLGNGVRRVEARAMVPHKSSRAFMLRCGAVEEGLLKDLGPDGLDYRLFAWRRSDWR